MVFLHVIPLCGLLMSFMSGLHGSHCDEDCADKPVFTPSSLVVKYDSPASFSCAACQNACQSGQVGMDVSSGQPKKDGTTMAWKVENIIDYDLKATCYYTKDDGNRCCSHLPVTVYNPPSYIILTLMEEDRELPEKNVFSLECAVVRVAPVKNVVVTFYKELKGSVVTLGQVRSNKIAQTEVENYALNVDRIEEDGSLYWCEAKLDLGPEGPQPPPVYASRKAESYMLSIQSSSAKLMTSFSLCITPLLLFLI